MSRNVLFLLKNWKSRWALGTCLRIPSAYLHCECLVMRFILLCVPFCYDILLPVRRSKKVGNHC